jgi:hypothetical protein
MRSTSRAPAAFCRAPRRAIPDRLPGQRTIGRIAVAALCGAMLATAAMAQRSIAGDPPRIATDVAEGLARLDCEHVSADDVRDTLARVPAPRIVLLQGSVPLVTMEPFARFLIRMGYPEGRLSNPRDGSVSYSSFGDRAALAGALAYDYEASGVEPMLIGHSHGGMQVIRVLHEFAGAFHAELPVIDPATGTALARTTIVDPRTQHSRPVVGLHVAYATALATGWLPRVLLGQWKMLPLLRRIPDTVTEFTGFDIPHDPIAGNLLGIAPYEATGSARVRNVRLPAASSHVALPDVDGLASDAGVRRSIEAWTPGAPASPQGDAPNFTQAADIWYSVKRHWCLQAQRLLAVPSP